MLVLQLKRIGAAFDRIYRMEQNSNLEKIEQANNTLESKMDSLISGKIDDVALQTDIEQKLNDLEAEYAPKLTSISEQLAKTITYVTPEMFGAIGNGINDDSEAIQFMLNHASAMPNSRIEMSKHYKITRDVVFGGKNAVITGGGIISGGSLVIYRRRTSFTDITNVKIKNITFEHNNVVDNLHGIIFRECLIGLVSDCTFVNCDSAIYLDVNDKDFYHNNARIIMSGNIFNKVNYCWKTADEEADGSAEWMQNADCHFINNMCNLSYKTHVWIKNIDGAIIKDNTMFFNGHASKDMIKMHNIYVEQSNFLIISNNNLFESGSESIYIKNYRTAKITDNNIVWSGQNRLASGIKIDSSVSSYPSLTCADNTIVSASKHGIEIVGTSFNIKNADNTIIKLGLSSYYYGGTPIDSEGHLAISAINSNRLINKDNFTDVDKFTTIGVNDNFIGGITARNFHHTRGFYINSSITSLDISSYNGNPYTSTYAKIASVSTISTIISDGIPGQMLTLIAQGVNFTLVHSSALRLKGSTNVTLVPNQVITLVKTDDSFVEVSRSF